MGDSSFIEAFPTTQLSLEANVSVGLLGSELFHLKNNFALLRRELKVRDEVVR
jgi:hypothetical protein